MKTIKIILIALLISIPNHHYAMEPHPRWLTQMKPQIISPQMAQLLSDHPYIETIAHLLLGIGNMNMLWKHSGNFAFTELPEDMRNNIITLIATGKTSTTLGEAAKIINALVRTSKELNSLINDPVFSLNLVKHLVKRFNSCEEDVCLAVHTKAAKEYLKANIPLMAMMQHRLQFFPQGLTDNALLDFNFRFDSVGVHSNNHIISPAIPGGGNLLMYAYHFNERTLQSYLQQQPEIDINLPNKNGQTALMVAIHGRRIPGHLPAIEFLNNYPQVNINQQDFEGNTALLIALQTSRLVDNKTVITPGVNIFVPSYYKQNLTPKKSIIKALLNGGANPELANNNGITPLQAAIDTNNDGIIQLILDAINKKDGS